MCETHIWLGCTATPGACVCEGVCMWVGAGGWADINNTLWVTQIRSSDRRQTCFRAGPTGRQERRNLGQGRSVPNSVSRGRRRIRLTRCGGSKTDGAVTLSFERRFVNRSCSVSIRPARPMLVYHSQRVRWVCEVRLRVLRSCPSFFVGCWLSFVPSLVSTRCQQQQTVDNSLPSVFDRERGLPSGC